MIARVLLCLILLAAAGSVEPPADLKRVRELAATGKNREEAAVLCRRVAEDPLRPAPERDRARRLLPELLVAAGHPVEARAEAATQAGLVATTEALILAKDGKRIEAIAALRAVTASNEPLVKARASLHLAQLLAATEKGKPANDALIEAITFGEIAAAGCDDPWEVRTALRTAQQAADRIRDPAVQERLLRAQLKEPVLSQLDQRERDDLTGRLGGVVEELKRFAEARTLYEGELARATTELEAAQREPNPDARLAAATVARLQAALTRWRLALARSWKNEGKTDKALAACEVVFSADSEPGQDWAAAQALVIDCLAEDPARAVAAAQVLYEATGGNDGIKRLAKALAKGVADGKGKGDAKNEGKREKALVEWLTHGAPGPDGITGNADDLTDPGLTWTRATSDTRAALARSIAVTTTQAARRRATLLLYAGQPAESAAVVRWWIGQARSAPEIGALAEVMARCAVALAKDPAARRRALGYLADGPVGADGKPGTADDGSDPLPGIKALTVPAPTGDDLALLQRLRASAARFASDDRLQLQQRALGLTSVLRCDLLMGSAPRSDELLDWYDGNPGGVLDAMYTQRFAADGHLAGLPEVQRLIATRSTATSPDLDRKLKSWAELLTTLRAGTAAKGGW